MGFAARLASRPSFSSIKQLIQTPFLDGKKRNKCCSPSPQTSCSVCSKRKSFSFRNSALPCVSLVQGLASLPSKTLAHPCKSSSTLPFPLHHLLPHIISSSFPSEWNPDSCSLLCIHGLPSVCLASFTCPPLHMILCFLCQTPCSSSPTPAKE